MKEQLPSLVDIISIVCSASLKHSNVNCFMGNGFYLEHSGIELLTYRYTIAWPLKKKHYIR